MTFEITLRRSLLSPVFTQFGENKPRPSKTKGLAHVVGRGVEDASGGQKPGGGDQGGSDPGRKYDARGCRRLETISPGEVHDAYALYEKQLLPTDDGALIKKNHFYAFPLLQIQKSVPAALFGRVKVCLPMDGHVQDAQEVELAFPQAGGKPDPIVLHPEDVDPQKPIQSYRFQVKVFGTDEDYSDIVRHESKFAEAGFALDLSDDLVELIDSPEMDDDILPWFQVIGSSWFAGFSSNLQEEIRDSLRRLSPRETLILNYHPGHTPSHVKKLNDELDYIYRLSDFYLSDPKTPEQILRIIKMVFNKVFADPPSKPRYLSNWQNKIK